MPLSDRSAVDVYANLYCCVGGGRSRGVHLSTTRAMTIFFLFFGIALIDALTSRAWMRVALWVAFGLLFLYAELRQQRPGNNKQDAS